MRIRYSIQAVSFLIAASCPSVGAAQSFDCGKAQTESEIAICENEHLSRMDEELLGVYRTALAEGDQDSVRWAGRRLWTIRSNCRSDVVCLENGYRSSIVFFSGDASQGNSSEIRSSGECDGCNSTTAEEQPEPVRKQKPPTPQTCEDGIGVLIAALKLRQSGYDLLGTYEKVVSDIKGDERLAYIAEEPTFSSDIMDMVRLAYSGQFDGFDLNIVQTMMVSNCLDQ